MTKVQQHHYPWNEGMPTKPDVDTLLRAWPDPQVGDLFLYSEIEQVLGVSRASNAGRFKTITNAWRKRLLEKGAVVECQNSESFYVASADQVASGTHGTLKSIGRKARKHRRKLCTVKTETNEQRNILAHQGRLLHEVERHSKKSRVNLLPSTAVRESPRITPQEKRQEESNHVS